MPRSRRCRIDGDVAAVAILHERIVADTVDEAGEQGLAPEGMFGVFAGALFGQAKLVEAQPRLGQIGIDDEPADGGAGPVAQDGPAAEYIDWLAGTAERSVPLASCHRAAASRNW